MLLTILRSESHLDRSAESQFGCGSARGLKEIEAKNEGGMIHYHFNIEDYPGETPHARLSIDWTDVEDLISKFAEKGNLTAIRLLRADKLAQASKTSFLIRGNSHPTIRPTAGTFAISSWLRH